MDMIAKYLEKEEKHLQAMSKLPEAFNSVAEVIGKELYALHMTRKPFLFYNLPGELHGRVTFSPCSDGSLSFSAHCHCYGINPRVLLFEIKGTKNFQEFLTELEIALATAKGQNGNSK